MDSESKINISTIKTTILKLGTKFARILIGEISEVCSIDNEKMIIKIVKKMIRNKEIYANYNKWKFVLTRYFFLILSKIALFLQY